MAKGKFAKELLNLAKKLDMSEAARMERASDSGFYGNTLYHGTSTSKSSGGIFDEFQLFEGQDMSRSVSRSPVGKLGVSLAEQPKLAEDFARQASPVDGEGAAILPLRFRSDKIASIELAGDETNDEVFGTVVEAWKEGFDAIQFKNYTTPAGTKGSFVLVKDPSQVRSVNAAFDPAKKDSANLLAGIGGAAILGGGSLSSNKASAFSEPRGNFASNLLSDYVLNARLPDTIEAPQNEWAMKAADWFDRYNRARKERLNPVADMLLPVGELPADLFRKYGYGDKTTISDRIDALLGLL